MRLRHAVFGCRIARFALLGNDLSLAANAALQLRLYILTTALLERIGAAAREHRASDHKQDRQGPHPLILESNDLIAN
jgi:hypothetical protein